MPSTSTTITDLDTRHQPARHALVGLLLGCAFLAAAHSAAQSAAQGADLVDVCRSLSTGDNDYFSSTRLDQLEDELRRSAADTPTDASANPTRVLLHANELMKHSRPDDAAALLESALERPNDPATELAYRFRLAVALLQSAEDQNCLEHRNADSCIVPLAPNAVHQRPDATVRAIGQLQIVVNRNPRDARAAWLLNLATALAGRDSSTLPGALRADAIWSSPADASAIWRDRAPQLGIDSLDLAGGAVLDDFDGDGLLDIVTSTWDPCAGMKAFRNRGDGGFEAVHEAWGLGEQLGGLNLLQADYDNDGDLDLLVLRGAWLLSRGRIRNSLLRNDLAARGRFVDVTAELGLAEPAAPTQTAAWGDYDLDGDLDLFVGVEATSRDPLASQLYENLGAEAGFRFAERAEAAGVVNLRYAKGSAWGDVDNDGDLDLYVSNFGLNRLYVNQGDRTFVDRARELGVTEPAVQSFATWFFDYENDGDLDLFVADYRPQSQAVAASYLDRHPLAASEGQPLLYRNLLIDSGELSFEEVSREVGITRPALPMGANFADIDNDGWLDVYLGTGEPDLASLMPNQLYRNLGGEFEEATFRVGLGHLQKGHGVAFGDIDNDGDVDLLHQLGGFYPSDVYGNALFENPGNDHTWITLRFAGTRSNRFGVGARVRLTLARSDDQDNPDGSSAPARRVLHRVVGSGGSFGASSLQLEIGLGDADRVDELAITWPSGQRDVHADVAVNRAYRVAEDGDLEPLELRVISLGDGL